MVRKCDRTYEVLSTLIMQQWNSILFKKSYLPRTAMHFVFHPSSWNVPSVHSSLTCQTETYTVFYYFHMYMYGGVGSDSSAVKNRKKWLYSILIVIYWFRDKPNCNKCLTYTVKLNNIFNTTKPQNHKHFSISPKQSSIFIVIAYMVFLILEIN